MTLCPVAIAVGCKKCPIFAICPVKGVIGDYKKEEAAPPRRPRRRRLGAERKSASSPPRSRSAVRR